MHAADYGIGVSHTFHVNDGTDHSNSFTLTWVDTTVPPPPPDTGSSIGSHVGAISMPLEQVQGVSDDWINAQADALADLGVGWQRGDYPAYLTEASEGVFTYTDADRWVVAALARGIKPLPILYMLPSWMNGSGNDKTPPIDDTDYATWAAAACDHLWGLGVRHVELWNEQNLAGFWNASAHTDSGFRVKYVNMAIEATTAIKAVTPRHDRHQRRCVNSRHTIWNDLGTPNPPGKGALSTIQRYAELGLFEHVDAVGWHPYIEDDGVCEDHGMAGRRGAYRVCRRRSTSSTSALRGSDAHTVDDRVRVLPVVRQWFRERAGHARAQCLRGVHAGRLHARHPGSARSVLLVLCRGPNDG